VNRTEYSSDEEPLDPGCRCLTCARYSKGYLRHLVRMSELSVHRLLTIHNLTYTLDLVAEARAAIGRGELAEYISGVRRLRQDGST
jgi:queuine tRNA-ribosyltransferase